MKLSTSVPAETRVVAQVSRFPHLGEQMSEIGEYVCGLPRCCHSRFDPLFMFLVCRGNECLIDHRTSDGAVRSESYVIFAANVDGMLQMADDVFGVWLSGGFQKRHDVNASHATTVRKRLERAVGRVSRQINQRTAAGVRDRHGRGRGRDSLRDGAWSGVT